MKKLIIACITAIIFNKAKAQIDTVFAVVGMAKPTKNILHPCIRGKTTLRKIKNIPLSHIQP
jgi:hypothetical protein